MKYLRVAVCGAVGWADVERIESVLSSLLTNNQRIILLTGMADGADLIARNWAINNGVEVHAECLELGEYPGPMHRYNYKLLSWKPDRVIAFKENFDPDARPNGFEPGTEHLVRLAHEAGCVVQIIRGPI